MRIAPTSGKMNSHAFQLWSRKNHRVILTMGQNDFDHGGDYSIWYKQGEKDLIEKLRISTQIRKICLIKVNI